MQAACAALRCGDGAGDRSMREIITIFCSRAVPVVQGAVVDAAAAAIEHADDRRRPRVHSDHHSDPQIHREHREATNLSLQYIATPKSSHSLFYKVPGTSGHKSWRSNIFVSPKRPDGWPLGAAATWRGGSADAGHVAAAQIQFQPTPYSRT